MSESELLSCLGYDPPRCFVYSQQNCFELARACFRRGLMLDAIVIADHGLRHGHYTSLCLVKAAAQIAIGDCLAAQNSTKQIVAGHDRQNNRSFEIAFDRLSGPEVTRVMELIRVYEGW